MNQGTTLCALARRGARLLRAEGPWAVLRQTWAFSGWIVGRCVAARSVYLYEHSLVPRDRAKFLPRVASWELRVIHSNEEADRVAAEGLEDLRDVFVFSRRSLDRGAVVFCVYIGTELAHVGWVATSQIAKNCVDKMPFQVAFDAGQACTGGTYTIRRFRGMGLMGYGYYERFEYLRQRGYASVRNSVVVSNVTSQKVHAKFEPLIYGVGRYRKLFRWVSWRTFELPGGPRRGMPPPQSGGR